MEIKIVGAITDENALEEIEDIAKIFAYEQHMKEYTEVVRTSSPAKKLALINQKDMSVPSSFIPRTSSSHIPVKGLC